MRPPIASLVVLLLVVAAVTVLSLGRIPVGGVPRAVPDGEQQIAADTALTMRTSVEAEAASVRRTADAYPGTAASTPTATLKALTSGRKSVLGSALLDARTGKLLAAGGSAVPLAGVDVARTASGRGAIAPRLTASDGPRNLLYFARVTLPAQQADPDQDPLADRPDRSWLLVVREALPAVTAYGDGRTVEVLDASGATLATATHGTASRTAADRGLPAAAARAAGGSDDGADASGSLLGASSGDRRAVAGWARVDEAAGTGGDDGLGLVVLTSHSVPATTAPVDHSGFALRAAGVLVGLALLLGLALRFCLQRPLLRLYLSAGRLAKGAGGGDQATSAELHRQVPVHGFGEVARIGRALDALRRQLAGESAPAAEVPGRRAPGYRALAVAGVVLLACWGAPMIFLLNRADTATAIPAAVLADQQTRTEIASNRLRQSLDQSYTDLSEAAAALPGRKTAEQKDLLRRVLDDHRQYRSLYLLDRSGDTTLRVGDAPLRTLTEVPGGSGITTVNTSGRLPAIAAYTPVPGVGGGTAATGTVLFGEIDVKVLNSTLQRPKLGSVWVTDGDDKVLASSVGYRAFQSLPESGLNRLVRATRTAPGTVGTAASAVSRTSSGPSVDAAAPLAQRGPTARLGWHVVTAEPAAALQIPAVQAEQRTMLAGILGLSLGAACLGWLHVVVIRPLRAVAVFAERLVGGDRRTVLHPVNHDEIGSITRSLELVRQALAERDRTARSAPAAGAARSAHANTLPR
ncbi:HAMP domain-containing protein [Streptomyces sp. NPDC003717]|uniref:HAMP domain-containing protein n=1 Tax=Streptomyces sp. NPDC003717 TaxID=3154276 RepID=UPI0033A7FC92